MVWLFYKKVGDRTYCIAIKEDEGSLTTKVTNEETSLIAEKWPWRDLSKTNQTENLEDLPENIRSAVEAIANRLINLPEVMTISPQDIYNVNETPEESEAHILAILFKQALDMLQFPESTMETEIFKHVANKLNVPNMVVEDLLFAMEKVFNE